jgi:predicted MFS family arabinose efflux permease
LDPNQTHAGEPSLMSVSSFRVEDRPANALPLAAVMASATIYTILQSLTYPLLALVLHDRKIDEWLVGVNAAMMPIGMLVAAGLAPRIVGRLGLYATCVISLVTVGCCMVGIGALNSYWYWIPLRFLTGILLSCIFVATDTWINELAEERQRGRIIGIYAMLLSLGCMIGPGILWLTGIRGFLPFGIAAVLPFCAAFPLFLARRKLVSSRSDHESTSIFSFTRSAPIILACVVAVGFADQAAMSLLPIYVLKEGFNHREASLSLIAMSLGSMSLMYPIWWLADTYSRTKLVIACAVATALLSALLPATIGFRWLFFVVVFAWGGIYYAVYTLTLVRLGEQFSGAALVAGNAACGAAWGIGGIFGAPVAGAAMGWIGTVGFPVSMAVVFGTLSVVLTVTAKRPQAAQKCYTR